jgi:hypothetical protein
MVKRVDEGFVFLRDDGMFDAPIDSIWGFLGSGGEHQHAHGHTGVRREVLGEDSGRYSWEQPFDEPSVRFTMRWTAFVPTGIAYDVLEGPFAGSKFFLCYRPIGPRTEVSIIGAFTSPSIPLSELEAAVRRFFAVEFEQDSKAIHAALHPSPGTEGAGLVKGA